jgi:protein-L-isoaspartate(D-aspartate) O-methyltransferase
MRKRVSQPDVTQPVPGRTGPVRYDSGRLSPGVTPANSNTRISAATLQRQTQAPTPASGSNLGLNSDRLRQAMVERLRAQGITDERVLNAMGAVPRHLFVDEALASRAYEDAALPIGHSQTISQPWVVARMIAAACDDRTPTRVLEVGAGCGYQAAVLAQFVREVHTIERIRGLYELAREHLRALRSQLAPGGRLIAPEGGANQRLVLIERTGAASWKRTELEAVRFVPLRAGIQS